MISRSSLLNVTIPPGDSIRVKQRKLWKVARGRWVGLQPQDWRTQEHLMSSSIQHLTEEGDIGLLFPDLQLSIRNSPGAHGFSFRDTAGVPLISLGEPTNSGGHRKGSPSLLDLRFLSSPRDIRPIGGLPERVAPPKQVAWPGKAFFPVVLKCVSPSQRYLGSWGCSSQHTVRDVSSSPWDWLSYPPKR